MARFSDSPPTDALPRAKMDLPEQAARPEDFDLPDVPAEAGPPEGLPAIPVVEQPENFPDDMPDEAELHLPWI